MLTLNHHTFLRFPGFKDKAITFSYDDGTTTDLRLADIFTKYGLKCTFNVCSGSFGSPNKPTIDELIKAYDKGGHEVAVHGEKHRSLGELHPEHAVKDGLFDRIAIEKAFSRVVKGMAYANGNYTDDVKNILKPCGINYARTPGRADTKFAIPKDWLEWKPTCHHDYEELESIVDEFLTPVTRAYYWAHTPRLLYIWGHSSEFDRKDNWDRIEDIAKKVSNRNDVYYATNGVIFEYVRAYDRLEFSVEAGYVYNPSAIDVYVNYIEKDVIAKAGQITKIED